MPFISGATGSLIVDATPDVTLHVQNWTCQFGNRLADVSTSAQSHSAFIGTLEDNSWSCELPLDTSNNEVSAGLIPGAVVSVWFKVGTTTTYHKLTNTTVESVTPTNRTDGDAHRLSISGRGGVRTQYGAAPS